MSSNFVAVSFGIFVVGLIAYFILSDERFITIAIFGFAMMLPFSVMFLPSKYENAFLIYSIIMTLVGLSAIGLTFSRGEMFNVVFIIFILGFVGFQWVVNYLRIKETNQ